MKTAERKQQLRRQAAGLPRANVPHLLERFLALPQVVEAKTVMVYYGVGREPDTAPLIRTLLEQGKRVVLPVCVPGRKMETRSITHEDQLIPSRYGIPEPDWMCPLVPRSEIDVVLVPCVMCDGENYRLGQGGGYFDRWLADYRGFTVCVCPADRMVERLPRESFDIPVRLVLHDA